MRHHIDSKRRRLWAVVPVAALSLALAGTALAGAAGPGHPGRGGPWGSHFGWQFGRGDAPLGSVSSLVGNTLTVLEFDGMTQHFTVTMNTHYFLDGKTATSVAVVPGLNVVVNSGRYWGGGSTTSPTANGVYLISPSVLGNIQGVSGTAPDLTITVNNPQGFGFKIATSAMTNYWVNGSSSTTAPTFTTGEIIAALGIVTPMGSDTLDATQINVVPKPAVRVAQTITFTSTPSSPTVGGTYDVTATGGPSGNPIVFAISPSTKATCSIGHHSNVVSFLAAGTCTIDAFQAGNKAYLAATAQQSFTVAS